MEPDGGATQRRVVLGYVSAEYHDDVSALTVWPWAHVAKPGPGDASVVAFARRIRREVYYGDRMERLDDGARRATVAVLSALVELCLDAPRPMGGWKGDGRKP